jgi:dGTP triphosphohydrolase
MEAEMARIMTPQEFDDYQLRMSQTAMVMRMQLSTFDPNEQEFKDIFRLRKKFEDDFGLMGMASTDKAEKEKRDEAQKEMKEQLKTILGQDRYAEYERGQDFVYQGIAKVAQRNNLSKDSAVKVYDMKKEAEAQAKKVREDKALSSEQRQAALQAIRAETENSVKAVFGDKAYESYKNQPNAYWINGLSPTSK